MAQKKETPSAAPKGPKHILLQQERIITHDKTWLPARLQPPQVDPSRPYAVYLQQYEQYLAALQYMKSRFLAGRRADPTKRLVYETEMVSYATSAYNTKMGSAQYSTAPGLRFGTVGITPSVMDEFITFTPPHDLSAPCTSCFVPYSTPKDRNCRDPMHGTEPVPRVVNSCPVPAAPVVVKNVTTPALKARRRAAKKARRKARRAAARGSALEAATSSIEAETAKVSAKVELVAAQAKLQSLRRQKAKRARKGPAAQRRKERRAAARAAPPPPPG